MSVVFIGLLTLIAATPVLLFFDRLLVVVIELFAATGMLIIAAVIQPLAGRHLVTSIRVPALLVAAPLLWILIQLLPLSIGGLSASIWESAATGLRTPLSARLSVDPDLTLLALSRLGSLAGIGFIAAAVSIERQQAERLLVVLAGAAGAMSLVLLFDQIGGFQVLGEWGARGAGVTAAVIGIVLFCATLVMSIERHEGGRQARTWSRIRVPLGLAITGLVICSLALVGGEHAYAIFAAACGVSVVGLLWLTRRLRLGPRVGLAVGGFAVAVAAVVIATKGAPIPADLSLRYMAPPNPDLASLYSRMIEAVGSGGSGGGTFGVVNVLYGMQGPPDQILAPTFAAKLAVELGRPALWIITALVCVGIVAFARSGFTRGRDFFYPLAGAALLVAMGLCAFTNAGLTDPVTSLLVAATLGLSCGQSVSRRF